MKYLVNKETKEHIVYKPCHDYLNSVVWRTVEADSEGWIKHEGKECPLPDDVKCRLKFDNGNVSTAESASYWGWSNSFITHYRPILEKAEPIPAPQYDPRSVSFKTKRLFDDLLERLEASHAAAQALPDLVAQLRDRLKPLGLGVMYLSEFDAVEPESGHKFEVTMATGPKIFDAKESVLYQEGFHAPQDMSDWRNWREGDLLTCIKNGSGITVGHNYELLKIDSQGDPKIKRNNFGETNGYFRRHFRFHSRPKGE
jgi:hypothetical protein